MGLNAIVSHNRIIEGLGLAGKLENVVTKKIEYTNRDIKDINEVLGANLRAARNNAGLSQSDVMKAIWGVSDNRNRICEIEKGRKSLTVIEILKFQELYGCSLDYLCGLSVEPELDGIAGTVNHVVNQSLGMVDFLTKQMAEVLIDHVKSVSMDNALALVEKAKALCNQIKSDLPAGQIPSIEMAKALRETQALVRDIECDLQKQQMAVQTQLSQRMERVDLEDKHHMMLDRRRGYQFSLPLPRPHIINDGEVAYEA